VEFPVYCSSNLDLCRSSGVTAHSTKKIYMYTYIYRRETEKIQVKFKELIYEEYTGYHYLRKFYFRRNSKEKEIKAA